MKTTLILSLLLFWATNGSCGTLEAQQLEIERLQLKVQRLEQQRAELFYCSDVIYEDSIEAMSNLKDEDIKDRLATYNVWSYWLDMEYLIFSDEALAIVEAYTTGSDYYNEDGKKYETCADVERRLL